MITLVTSSHIQASLLYMVPGAQGIGMYPQPSRYCSKKCGLPATARVSQSENERASNKNTCLHDSGQVRH